MASLLTILSPLPSRTISKLPFIAAACFYATPQGVGDFTRFYLSAKPDVTKDFVVTDEVISDFRKYLDKQHIKYTEPEIRTT